MATVVYGGSPRHHNRIMVTSSGNALPTSVVPNFHNQMLAPAPHSYAMASASYHHQCHAPNAIVHHQHQQPQPQLRQQDQYTHTITSTSTIISQTQIYAPPKPYNVPVAVSGQPKLHKQLPLTPSQQQQQQQQQQLPPQLPPKIRQRHHPSNASLGSIPMECATARFIKRKTAVELLAESKPYYVKSEVVLDRKQHLNQLRGGNSNSNSSGGVCGGSGGGGGVGGGRSTDVKLSPTNDSSKLPYVGSPSHTFPHRRTDSLPANRRSIVANSELLQTKLRRLLNDPKEQQHQHCVSTPSASDDNIAATDGHFYQRPHNDFDSPTRRRTLPKFLSPQRLNQELTIHSISDQNSDNSLMYPSAFLSPQSLPPQHFLSDDDLPCYDYCDNDNSLILTAELQPISPPAEYAEGNCNSPPDDYYQGNRQNYYQRSNSHSQNVDSVDAEHLANARKSHKSLPDLHAQTSRHSPHSDAMSYRSRGNRSNKSGSSMNRDSGGSSGHYTHRSESFAKQQQQQSPQPLTQAQKLCIDYYRRDSGSSTQHSNNSYRIHNCLECNAKCDENCLLNFTTSEVPDAFKDDYVDQSRSLPYSPTRRPRPIGCDEIYALTATGGNGTTELDLSPPLGTFRRQRCLRIKQHPTRTSACSERTIDNTVDLNDQAYDDRKPILRSKSDISHRYWHRNIDPNEPTEMPQTSNGAAGQTSLANGSLSGGQSNLANSKKLSKSENLLQLERFFDHLGLNDDKYEEYIAPRRLSNDDSDHSSPTFFSDVSTVDSTQLLDSTETQATIQPYRPIETTSIVERNARIIKWLCTCRKLQMT